MKERCLFALSKAVSGPDRAALLRTWAWLEGGRLDLSGSDISLTQDDVQAAHRLGLAISQERIVRLREERAPVWWPWIDIDPVVRRAMVRGTPDAILLRHTSNRSYQSQAQKAAIRALVTQPPGSALMASLPTGAGKSLLFQLAALDGRARHGGACVIVITPTIALALDHERSLSTIPGLESSRALTGDQRGSATQEIIDAFRRGEVPILLLSPEAALKNDIAAALAEAASLQEKAFGLNAKLTHLFVDEAHIVEAWGRNFRPDFQRLPGLLSRLRDAGPSIRLVLLSATLTPAARDVLKTGWRKDGPWLEIDARVPRFEHDVVVQHFPTAEERLEALAFALDRVPRPAIVYTTEIEHANTLHRWLTRERGYQRVGLFTGDTSGEERRFIVQRWAANELDIVVATSAFGMGVDKPDVRSVIHACLPENPSRWYQEIGRAARDGGQGLAVLLFTSNQSQEDDVARAHAMAVGGWLTRDLAEKRWKAMLAQGRGASWIAGRFTLSVDLDAVREGLNPNSSDYNRNWNMALLTLLQRAGVIEIQSVTQGDDVIDKTWSITILDPGLLDGRQATWDAIFAIREAEVENAKAAMRPFIRLTQHPEKACITRGAFELIEPQSFAPPCGRCPACRAEGIEPPKNLPCGGLETVWPTAPYTGSLPIGPLLLEADDPSLQRKTDQLLLALSRIGIEQFIVPDQVASDVAETLCHQSDSLGLVLAYSEWTGDTQLAAVPSALLMPAGLAAAAACVLPFVEWGRREAMPSIVVAEGSRVVGERRLDQWVSRFAPVTQAWLDDMARDG